MHLITVLFLGLLASDTHGAYIKRSTQGPASMPTLTLGNTASPNVVMPFTGLGTGAYSNNPASVQPECWAGVATAGAPDLGCSARVIEATKAYIALCRELGQPLCRIDQANSYENAVTVGQAIKESGAPRSSLFILSKIGPSHPLGGPDALQQMDTILSDMDLTYLDLVLIHWPFDSASQGNVSNSSSASSDPACQPFSPATYNMTTCRLNTWRAMLQIWQSGKARAVGVSNYNMTHFQEIIDAGLPLPALSQNPFHIYRSSSQQANRDWMEAHNITFLAYSPLGVPDWHQFPAGNGMSSTPLIDPVVLETAAAHSLTPAQVNLQWIYQLGLATNPRSLNVTHMEENLRLYSLGLRLTDDEMTALSTRPQAWCTIDPTYYDCAY